MSRLGDRFWSKVRKTDGCWLWTASTTNDGYGQFRFKVDGKWTYCKSHRLAYEDAHGEIPHGMMACHKCDNPSCVNPDHLFIGTPKDNMLDMMRKNRSCFGERCHSSKITAADAIEIRKQRANGVALRELAERFGISNVMVSKISRGVSWSRAA